MKRAGVLPLQTIVSLPYIQSRTWIFATDQDRQRFERAVALLPDLDWAAEEKDVAPVDRKLARSLGLPAGNVIGRALRVRSQYHLTKYLSGGYGQTVLACVLAMSSSEHPIIVLKDTEAGARIASYLPMNMWTWPGILSLNIDAKDEQGIAVEGHAIVRGQLIDWGRCRREVNRVLREVQIYLAAMGATNS
jgi:hypothetical protein